MALAFQEQSTKPCTNNYIVDMDPPYGEESRMIDPFELGRKKLMAGALSLMGRPAMGTTFAAPTNSSSSQTSTALSSIQKSLMRKTSST
jgi:hypothetical protein